MRQSDLVGWEIGFSGTSWFKKDRQGNTWQAIGNEDNETVVFVPAFGPRIECRLAPQQYRELFYA